MPPRRTIRKPTRWTPQEWREIEQEARKRAVPPLRFVREAALSAIPMPSAAPSVRRRRSDELVHQLGRVLNNLRQLGRVAEIDGAEQAVAWFEAAAGATTAAMASPPERAREAAAVLDELIPAGTVLNALAHRANATGEIPPEEEVRDALVRLQAALRGIGA